MVGKKQTRRPAGAEDFIEVSGLVRTETVAQAGLITADCRVAAYLNSLFSNNTAIGFGANPQRPGTPGGGSGGAIYNDGNSFDLTICGSRIESNHAREGGGAIFFVSNDRSGHLIIDSSTLTNNPSEGFETPGYRGIFYLGDGPPQIDNSIIE